MERRQKKLAGRRKTDIEIMNIYPNEKRSLEDHEALDDQRFDVIMQHFNQINHHLERVHERLDDMKKYIPKRPYSKWIGSALIVLCIFSLSVYFNQVF